MKNDFSILKKNNVFEIENSLMNQNDDNKINHFKNSPGFSIIKQFNHKISCEQIP